MEMRIATYQPLFRAGCNPVLKTFAEEILKASGDRTPAPDDFRGAPDEALVPVLGFDPVWCFPADNVKTAFAHSMLSAPNAMDLFFLLDTENYVRIDKIKHYQNIKAGMRGADCIQAAIAPDCPDKYSEILVPVDELQNMNLSFPVMLAHLLIEGISDLPPIIGADKIVSVPKELVEYCFPFWEEALCTVEDISVAFPSGIADMDEKDVDYRMHAEKSRLLFSVCLLPVLYHALEDNGCRIGDMLSCSLAVPQAIRIFSRMGRWSYESCEKEEYDRLYDDIAACVIDSPAFFDHFLEHGFPARNERCPCGSGKKFKKCCGRMLL